MNFNDESSNYKKNRRNRWMLSYSDFTTILMAIFIVLYANGNIELTRANEKIAVLESQIQEIKPENSDSQSRDLKEIAEIIKNDLKDINGVEFLQEKSSLTIRIGESLLFDEGSSEIKQNSKNTLSEIANILTKNENQIKIIGHSDNIPIKNLKYSSNWELASSRASNIAQYLIEIKNLDKKRFTVLSHADNKPVEVNSTPQGRAKNRRVDIVITN